MNKIYIAFMIIIICSLGFIFFNPKKTNQPIIIYKENIIIDNLIENELYNSFDECKILYKQHNMENFDIYFNIDSINRNLNNGKAKLISDINDIDFSFVDMYDFQNNKIIELPNELNDDII